MPNVDHYQITDETTTKTKPLFFTQRDVFIASLTTHLHLPTTINNLDEHSEYLASYCQHYHLNFVEQGIARSHQMWKSEYHTQENTYTIVQQFWQSQQHSKGTVVIVHGYLDHMGLYGRAIVWALEHGYDVLGFDLPGHGLSSGQPASIQHFASYSDIFTQIINTNKPILKQPLIALGQSTGCSIICHALLVQQPAQQLTRQLVQQDIAFKHVILLAPLVRSHHWRYLRYLYFALKPFITSIKRQFVRSSHNDIFHHFIKYNDPLQAKKISLQWLGAMEQWYQTIKQLNSNQQNNKQGNNTSLSIIQGTGDTTVDWRYNIPALTPLFPNSHIHYIDHAQHHLVNESDNYWQSIRNHLNHIISTP